MAFLPILRKGVEIANKLTKDLQAPVSYVRTSAPTEYGEETPASATTLRAIVDFKHVQVRTAEGIMTMASATLTLLDVAEVSAATGGLGVKANDEFYLPDGSKSKVIAIGGFMDAGTYGKIPLTIYLG